MQINKKISFDRDNFFFICDQLYFLNYMLKCRNFSFYFAYLKEKKKPDFNEAVSHAKNISAKRNKTAVFF